MRRTCARLKARQTAVPVAILGILLGAYYSKAKAEGIGILQRLEPGIGYTQFKQWAIQNKLVFENFTKDSMVVRDTGVRTDTHQSKYRSGSAPVTTTVVGPQALLFKSIFSQRSMWWRCNETTSSSWPARLIMKESSQVRSA